MPAKWGPELHESCFFAFILGGAVSTEGRRTIIENWPADRGPAPTDSALSQQLTKLRKELGTASGGKATTPTQNRAKSTTTTPRSQNRSAKASAAKQAYFSRPQHDSSSDDEEEKGDSCETESSSPAPPIERSVTVKTEPGQDRSTLHRSNLATSSPLPRGSSFVDQLKNASTTTKRQHKDSGLDSSDERPAKQSRTKQTVRRSVRSPTDFLPKATDVVTIEDSETEQTAKEAKLRKAKYAKYVDPTIKDADSFWAVYE